MAGLWIIVAAVLFLCILADRFSGKFGMPALILFMGIGMLFGSDGLFRISFEDYQISEKICAVALIFIMFYGGFNVKWETAKPVVGKALLLSTAGVIITMGLTSLFCYYILHFSFTDSFLTGAVLSSTDAASVFAVLRKKKLNMKDGVASLLELESGSNDPVSYMLTVVGILLKMGEDAGKIPVLIVSQIIFGVILGVFFGLLGIFLLRKTSLITEGLDTIFMIGLILLVFGLSELIGGNEFLSVYLMGIILGNSRIRGKEVLVPFFDGITSLAQIVIFFLLGLLSFPHKLPEFFGTSLMIVLFLTLVARPVAVIILLKPFHASMRQCMMVSWAGLRGAASIVFSVMVMTESQMGSDWLYHIVFMVALISVAVQGTFLPKMASLLDMVDANCDVRKTFNDYQEESSITMMRMYIPHGHNWENKKISEVHMPTGSLALMIKREEDTVIPRGDTVIYAGDSIILNVPSYESENQENLTELRIGRGHEWCDKTIEELNLPEDILIALIKRGTESLIPAGKTRIHAGDIVVTYH